MPATKASASVGTVITPAEVRRSRRGRKGSVNVQLRDFLAELNDGDIAAIALFGPVPAENKDQRSKVGTTIRNHWKLVKTSKPAIAWNPETNLPQVGRAEDMRKQSA